MSYTPTVWANGDVVTSEKLNKIENGIASGTLMIGGFSFDGNSLTGTSDKTWQEIDNALAAGVRCVVTVDCFGGHVQTIITGATVYSEVYSITNGTDFTVTTTSADGYPAF